MCTRVCLLTLFLLAIHGLGGCSRENPPDPPAPPAESEPGPRTRPADRPNVILITIDTLRADHLGCYGYKRPTSPRIDAFARQATFYTRACASAPWTVPTHASLFTGKYSFEHGAHTFKVSEPVNNVNPLPLEHLTLAEALKSEGYQTGAFAANSGYLSTRWQLDQGFDTYHVERSYADKLNRRVFEWLAAQGDKDFFLFINYIDTHSPYNTAPRPGLFEKPLVRRSRPLRAVKEQIFSGAEPIPRKVIQQAIDQYDTAVANVDEEIGALLDKLVTADLYDDTMIVLTSDHGNYFGEHRLAGHSKDVYQEVLWVPLIVKSPNQRTGRISDVLVSSTDIPRMILSELAGELAERYSTAFPDAPGNHVVISENYFTRLKDLFDTPWGDRFHRVRRVVFDWPYKYIDSSDGQHELYQLVDDPAESHNLLEQRAEVAARLAKELRDFQSRRQRWEGQLDTTPLTEEDEERLRALGYMGD